MSSLAAITVKEKNTDKFVQDCFVLLQDVKSGSIKCTILLGIIYKNNRNKIVLNRIDEEYEEYSQRLYSIANSIDNKDELRDYIFECMQAHKADFNIPADDRVLLSKFKQMFL